MAVAQSRGESLRTCSGSITRVTVGLFRDCGERRSFWHVGTVPRTPRLGEESQD